MKIFFYFVTFVTPHPILSVLIWEPLPQKMIGFAMTALFLKLNIKSDTRLRFRSLDERPLVEEHASILAIRREPRPRVLERPPTRVSAHLNDLSTPIPSETRTNLELGVRMLRCCRIQELHENCNAFRKGSSSLTSKSSDPADDTKLRNVEGGATSSGRSSQPHCSAKSMEQVHGMWYKLLGSFPCGTAHPNLKVINKLVRATEIVKLMSLEKSVKGAIRIVTALKLPTLAERFNTILEER
ncbi:hypothetical protein RHGRI_034734 [Rhododendron griersonianum]|uniref:Uncharacterized protein n=1 Tax=Rhododendron griersonianum TaxID=479676 RepID=A0AAV6I584_9ERIC|nr:hypothetical protein RHGRI_034734 [Rhododendron griersonianum]